MEGNLSPQNTRLVLEIIGDGGAWIKFVGTATELHPGLNACTDLLLLQLSFPLIEPYILNCMYRKPPALHTPSTIMLNIRFISLGEIYAEEANVKEVDVVVPHDVVLTC